jgi:hypothetical protein
MQAVLIALLAPLIFALAAALIGVVLRPRSKPDAMQQVIGDAPRLSRGGYAAMDERAPIEWNRAS